MPKSLASNAVSIVDVPEPKLFTARFEYNFFVADEVSDDSGDVSPRVLERLATNPHTSFFEEVNNRRRIPRLVRFDFVPTKAVAPTDPAGAANLGGFKIPRGKVARPPRNLGLAGEGISIAGNLDKIMTEEEFSNFGFTGINFQDTQIDGKLYFLASGSISSRINGANGPLGTNPERFRIDPAGLSFVEAADFLNRSTPTSVDGTIGSQVMNQADARQVSYINERGEKIVNSTFSDLKQVRLRAQLSNKHVHKMLSYLVHETTTIYCDEIRGILPQALRSEELARRSALPDTINLEEYDTRVRFVDVRPWVDDVMPQLSARVIGYIIDKYELREGEEDRVIRREPIILERQGATYAADFKIRYASTYIYSIRSVATVEFPAVSDDDNGQVFIATALVSSQPSPRQVIQCVERVPPPPPADFNVNWDFAARKPRLTWCLPVNTQQDVKKFQVFRRPNTSTAFQMVRMFDFNDANPPMPDLESPDERLVEVHDQPVLMYIDRKFEKGEVWIYAVCSIDAHGFSSGYSAQFEISFDRFRNNIRKKLVSVSGAPKQYPNLNIEQDTFIDSIKDSNHTHVRVAFTPEVLELHDRLGNDLGLIRNREDGAKYRMQIINVDFQKQEDIDIELVDLRRPVDNTPARGRPKPSIQFRTFKG